MISTRSLATSMLCTMLLASLTYAQGVQLSPASSIVQRLGGIEELAWRPLIFPSLAFPVASFHAPSVTAPDLSRYRDFQLGMGLTAVVKQVGMAPSDTRVIHQRPAVIQQLEWRPQRAYGTAPGPEGDSVKNILFSFYNGELFRMVVHYDSSETEGLTIEDMVEAVSVKYGTPTRPAEELTFQYDEKQKVLARWEDSRYSFNLVRPEYAPSFTMVVLSKPLDLLAQAAIVEAGRLDKQEAPQREVDRLKKIAEDRRVQQDKARLANKARFRP